jgi:hypothetical protein
MLTGAIGVTLLLQLNDSRVAHRHHGHQAVDIVGRETGIPGGQLTHAEFHDIIHRQALGALHERHVFPVIPRDEQRDGIAVDHRQDLSIDKDCRRSGPWQRPAGSGSRLSPRVRSAGW